MRAHRIVASQQPAELCEVPTPEPGPGEILLKVGGAGLCHSDLHLMHWPIPLAQPFTLGHETAGWVEAVGAGVHGVELGEPVLVHGAWGCGRCRRCQADLEQYCEREMISMGVDVGSGATVGWPSTCWSRPFAISCRSVISTRGSGRRSTMRRSRRITR